MVVELEIRTNGSKKVDKVSDSMTLREIYAKYGINFESCTNSVDSCPLRPGDLDRSLRELGCGSKVMISSMVKMDNAAKAVVAGSCVVIKSKYKLEQWQKALKYDPDLGLFDEDDNCIFRVFVEEGPGSLNKNGVVFSDVPDEEGFAIATLIIDPATEDKKELVKDTMGLALVNLKAIEDELDEVIADAEKHDREIEEMVESI